MSEAWSEVEAFGELRSLMARRSSAEAFARVCVLIDEAEAASPGLYAQRWRGYLAGHLERWQARHCTVELERREQAERAAEAPWAELVKGVDLTRFDLSNREDVSWVAGELRERFPDMAHLGVSETSIRKSALELACREGVFDGLSSVAFDAVDLRPTTLEVVMDRLELLDEVEHLRFRSCSLGNSQFERITRTSLAPRLRSLGLPAHARFKASQAKALAARADAFERLERLDLRACSVAGSGAKALAEADWPDTFAYLNLNRNGIRGMGITALAESGLIGSIVEEGGKKTLDLAYQQIGNKGFQAVVDSGVLDGVVELRLWDCNLTRLDAFRGIEGLEKLEELGVHSNGWAEDEDGSALLGVIDRAECLERFWVTRSGLGDDFVERLLASPGVANLVELGFTEYYWCSARDLEAVLAWGGFEELASLTMTVGLHNADADLIARATATGRFVASPVAWGHFDVLLQCDT